MTNRHLGQHAMDASIARWEGEGGALSPHMRWFRHPPAQDFDKFEMWNFGGSVDASAEKRMWTDADQNGALGSVIDVASSPSHGRSAP